MTTTDDAAVLRTLPRVDAVLDEPAAAALAREHGRSALREAVRAELAHLRVRLREHAEVDDQALTPACILEQAEAALGQMRLPHLREVINATGIILHTGLGRAPMPMGARARLTDVAGYCNVQFELATGNRVHREANVRELACALTGAEDALVVNNNAGATLLVLQALAAQREVVISRGELIEIGGAFRLPEIMALSGAAMREVGTTNRTRVRDYAAAIGPATAMLFKAHKSNYAIVGFTEETALGELVALGQTRGVPVVDDLGCGAMVDLAPFGIPHETTMAEAVQTGADVVLASTDKLIGGPQGGLIVGRRALLAEMRISPLYRALRVDKLTLAALEETLKLFREPERLVERHPLYGMLARSDAAMRSQAEAVVCRIRAACADCAASVVEDEATLGGGTTPGAGLPGIAVRLLPRGGDADGLARALRLAATPVVAHIRDGAVLLNMRTVAENETDALVESCVSVAP